MPVNLFSYQPDQRSRVFSQWRGRYFQTAKKTANARRQRAEHDKPYFCQTYFPQNVPYAFTPQHKALFSFCDIPNELVIISAFREWGKSTLASYIDLLHKIAYHRISVAGFGSNNQRLALQFSKAIKDFLEDPPPESERFRQDFPELVGTTTGTQYLFTTRAGIKVFGIGAGMTPRGFIDFRRGERIDFFCLDDL